MRLRMVLNFIGLVVLLCALANANESNKGSQGNCNWAHGAGTCTSVDACESYAREEFNLNELYPCSTENKVSGICCPTNTQAQRQTLEASPLGSAQRTSTNRLNPTGRISNPSAINDVCNTKLRNCYENSYCVSNLGNGICKRKENCESYNRSRSFFPCNDHTICCLSTPTETSDTRLQVNKNQLLTRTKRTTYTTVNSYVLWDRERRVTSSSNVKNTCNTLNWTGNCNEGSTCTSSSGSGICRQSTYCHSVHTAAIKHTCSYDLICCLSTQSSRTTPEINRSMSGGSTSLQNSARSSNVILRTNMGNTNTRTSTEGKSCNSSLGPGTCLSKCELSLHQRKITFSDITQSGRNFKFCCPNNGTTEQGAVKNETPNRCTNTSNPRKDIVCCPQVTRTSVKPRTRTMRIAPIPKPEPQLRPSEKACEVYKATNPKRLLTHTPGVMETINGEFPHVGIVMGSSTGGGSSLRPYCGAALIARRFSLTSANCARNLPQKGVIQFGSVDTNPIKTTAQSFVAEIMNIWLQDDNKASEDYHDLAVLEFFKDIPLSSYVHPACLRVEEHDLPRSVNLYVNGWTTNDESHNYTSPVLYTSTVNTAVLLGCNHTHYNLGVSRRFMGGVQSGQYCARNSKREQCDGDFGFPLMRDTNGQFEILGILSLEFGCSSTLPSIYTRVAYYIDWIEDIVWPEKNKSKNI